MRFGVGIPVFVALAIAGCGGGGTDDSVQAHATGTRSPGNVRQCLNAASLKVTGGPAPAGDTNAPATELVVGGAESSAFLAFYENAARARRYAPDIRANAKRLHATVERHGKLTILWIRGAASGEAQIIRRCA
jgi:hypothetical protein